jgi:GAF domain-containing protein
MQKLAYPKHRISSYIILIITYSLYVVVFTMYHDRFGTGIASLATIPVIGASWYFGIKGGMLTAIFCVLSKTIIQMLLGHSISDSFLGLFTIPTTVIGTFALIFVAFVVGRLSDVTRERREAVLRLENYEKELQARMSFLEVLNEITKTALEARDLESTLTVLVENIAKLFEADDCFLALWDEVNEKPIPMVAHGSMKVVYPHLAFEAGEHTLAASLMKAGHPLAITDLQNSPYVSPEIASLFPSRAVLGLPLIVQDRKLATLYLSYNERHAFDQKEINQAEIVAQQVALVLTKTQLLEDAERQVKQLKVLHEVALVSTQVETIDQLIERVTEIIGKNLFPDNFGILLMDEEKDVLHPHSSYRFGSSKDLFPTEIPLGQGITGQVAEMGQPIRIGNVIGIQNYLDVDQRTSSELCVPIKLKARVLGVINAESTRTDAFSIDDEFLLGTLAGQLATAIEQLRTAQAERR